MSVVAKMFLGLLLLVMASFEVCAVLTVVGVRDGSLDQGSPLAAAIFLPIAAIAMTWFVVTALREDRSSDSSDT